MDRVERWRGVWVTCNRGEGTDPLLLAPYSLLAAPYSLLAAPYSLLATPYSLLTVSS